MTSPVSAIILSAVIALASSSLALAADDAAASPSDGQATTTGSPADVSDAVKNRNVAPEKKQLILELLKVTDADKNAQTISDAVLANHQKQIPLLMSKLIDSDEKLTAAQKKAMIAKIDESTERTGKRLREVFDEKINLASVLNQVALNVYDKYFTDNELKDIIAFYKSSTGQKSMRVLPQVAQESLDETTKILLPKMESVLLQVLEEERGRLTQSKG